MAIMMMLALPRDAASIPLARHIVTAALAHAGVSGDCAGEVEVAVSEACTNAYRHAHGGDSFEVVLEVGDDDLTVDVIDAATAPAPAAAPVATPGTYLDGGASLMAAFSDQVVFDSVTDGGGWVRLRKHLRWADDAPFHGGRWQREPLRLVRRQVAN
jgi:serine/threonine-protein kinase RsbW